MFKSIERTAQPHAREPPPLTRGPEQSFIRTTCTYVLLISNQAADIQYIDIFS